MVKILFGSFALLLCLLVRLSTLEITDLIDPTETRYAYIAQQMLLSGDFLTPKLPGNNGPEPYLGKPPLHFWLTSACYWMLEIDEWTARFPSFLGLLVIVGCTIIFARQVLDDREAGTLAAVISVSSGLLFFLAGASVVDVTFAAWLCGAWTCLAVFYVKEDSKNRKFWGLAVFFFLALAFLTKGPVALVLFLLSIAIFSAYRRTTAPMKLLPWRTGLLLFAALVVPWFWLAESRNPGFLRYFFWNEHFARYLFSDYGDMYGKGHVYPRGTVWAMTLLAFMPWSLPLLTLLMRGKLIMQTRRERDWMVFLLLWGISPALFFSLARQLHAAYVLPGIPGLALLTAYLLKRSSKASTFTTWFRSLSHEGALLISSALVPIGIYLGASNGEVAYSLLLLLVLALIVRFSRRISAHSSIRTHITSGVCFVLLFSIFIVQGSTYAEARKSPEELLYRISASLPGVPDVAVVNTRIYSLFWTAGAWQEELERPVTVRYLAKQDIIKERPDNLMVKDGYEQALPSDVLVMYRQMSGIGAWNWLRRADLLSAS